MDLESHKKPSKSFPTWSELATHPGQWANVPVDTHLRRRWWLTGFMILPVWWVAETLALVVVCVALIAGEVKEMHRVRS